MVVITIKKPTGLEAGAGTSSSDGTTIRIPNPNNTSGTSKDGAPSAPKIRIKGFNNAMSSIQTLEKKNMYGDEALAEAPIEEHLILQLPPQLATRLSATLQKKEAPTEVSMIFSDPRQGKFKYGQESFNACLVDLPCIIESLKTIDTKQYYKIADISQMVIVEPKSIPKDHSWPDGLTPPLKNVRKQRFRQRMSKKAIEDVEKEVERLLQADAEAEDVIYEVHDRKEDEEYGDERKDQEEKEALDHHDDPDFLVELQEALDADSDDEKDDDFEGEEEANRAAAAAAMEEYDEEETVDGDDDEEEEDEDDGGSDAGQDTEEQIQLKEAIRLLKDEIRDLDSKIEEKRVTAASQVNPIMKRRFEEIVNKLAKERDIKLEQLESLKEDLTTSREEARETDE